MGTARIAASIGSADASPSEADGRALPGTGADDGEVRLRLTGRESSTRHDFVLWLADYKHAGILMPGVLLSGYASLRMLETLALRWGDLDLDLDLGTGTATVEDMEDHEVKTLPSIRKIPLPEIVLEQLRTMKKGMGADKVVPYDHDSKAYGKLLKRALRKWRPGIKFAPKDLRSTLMNDAQFKTERQDWNELLVRFYAGHGPRNQAEAHYCNQRKSHLTELWRTEVVAKVDELVNNCHCSRCAEKCQKMSTGPENSLSPQAQIVDIV